LVKRSQSHFITLPCGIDVLLGVNGYIWVSKHPDEAKTEDPEALYSNENEVNTNLNVLISFLKVGDR
jgi:exosome complex component RRP4